MYNSKPFSINSKESKKKIFLNETTAEIILVKSCAYFTCPIIEEKRKRNYYLQTYLQSIPKVGRIVPSV